MKGITFFTEITTKQRINILEHHSLANEQNSRINLLKLIKLTVALISQSLRETSIVRYFDFQLHHIHYHR